MEIKFLRPELETLHARMQAMAGMKDTAVTVDALAWEVHHREQAWNAAADVLYPGVLLPYLTERVPPPASLLYVGGGLGRGVIPLAQAGYGITLLMSAAAGLESIYKEADAAGVGQRLRCVCGYAADATALGEAAFDAVLGLESIRIEQDLESVLASLLRTSRDVLCFDVMSRYGFLVGRMPGPYPYTAGFTPAGMLHVLTARETPGGRPFRHERYPLYTFEEVTRLVGEIGLEVDSIMPVGHQEVLGWNDGADEAARDELARRAEEDEVLRELCMSFLVLGRRQSGWQP